MDYLSSDKWDEIKNRLKDKFIFLFLDYDGTLTPIVETPDKAVISQEAKELLKKLSKNHDCKISIISGRSLNDVKNTGTYEQLYYEFVFYRKNAGMFPDKKKFKEIRDNIKK